ncbi:MAG: DUF5060 domain-containing protein [Opitutales bacterium]
MTTDLERAVARFGPTVDWHLEPETEPEGNPYDCAATVVFTDEATGEVRTTGLYWDGAGAWAFRFAPTREGRWTFAGRDLPAGLPAFEGRVTVGPPDTISGNAFVTARGNRWAWQATGQVLAPQWVMYRQPDDLAAHIDAIPDDIETFLTRHGFHGFHVPVFCRWLDIDKQAHTEFEDPDPNPDPRTFAVLETLIRQVHQAGGMVHFWMWGDNDANHRQTPMRDDWGGINGRVDRRLQRYLAARLGPLPGWTLGYGYDLEHWVSEEELAAWHRHLSGLLGWPHLLGARAGSPGRDGRIAQICDGLDYAGYTQFRPTPGDYRALMEANPQRPVLSEDRFRIRDSETHAAKDYDQTMTRRGLWHSWMVGGMGNIWGCFVGHSEARGMSLPYPDAGVLLTCRRFFEDRFTIDLEPDPDRPAGAALRSTDGRYWLLYAEDAGEIELSGVPEGPAVAVDTCQPYKELPVTLNGDSWQAPHVSDWALAIG